MTAPLTGTTFVHRFLPGSQPQSPVLLLLHGTGGTEEDLIPLGRQLSPGAALLSIRGRVLENGMPRFFRRLAEGVFDQKDLLHRTQELYSFLSDARETYGLRDSRIIAAGYSNGANIASSLLLREPHALQGAILLRAMVPFEPESLPDLSGTPVFLAAGRRDPIVPESNTRSLEAIYKRAGATVELHWHPGGHELGSDDVQAAHLWLARQKLTGAV